MIWITRRAAICRRSVGTPTRGWWCSRTLRKLRLRRRQNALPALTSERHLELHYCPRYCSWLDAVRRGHSSPRRGGHGPAQESASAAAHTSRNCTAAGNAGAHPDYHDPECHLRNTRPGSAPPSFSFTVIFGTDSRVRFGSRGAAPTAINSPRRNGSPAERIAGEPITN